MTPHRYAPEELPEGITITAKGYLCSVRVNGVLKQKRFKFGTTLTKMNGWRDDMRAELKTHAKTPQPVRGTLQADVARWLDSDTRKAMAGYAAVRSGLRAWLAVTVKDKATTYAELSRSAISRDHVLHARDVWTAAAVAPKTINNRCQNLGQLFHDLDGSKIATPVDDVQPLEKTYHAPQFVTPAIISKVARALAHRPLDQARYMVLTSTGMRPATLKRALRDDVILSQRGWLLRPTKGGNPVPLSLTPDMLAAVKRYIEVGGFEHPSHSKFDVSDYGRLLRDHGWPANVKPYSAKHTIGITLRKGGADWRDIAEHFGHKDHNTSKIYTGVVFSQHTTSNKILAKRALGFAALASVSRKQPVARRVKDGEIKQRLARKNGGQPKTDRAGQLTRLVDTRKRGA